MQELGPLSVVSHEHDVFTQRGEMEPLINMTSNWMSVIVSEMRG